MASPQAQQSCREIAGLGLRATVLTHTRCVPDDVRLAIDCGVGGVDLLFGTSSWLRTHSNRLDIDEIIDVAGRCIELVRAAGIEVRFSCEDSFRTNSADLLRIHGAVAALGVDRVGLADTVGIATPARVSELVSALRATVACDIEFHAHNDTGCAVANALAALEAGATHVDTTILGIGERNGIVPLAGLVARLLTVEPALVDGYRLEQLPALDRMVAEMLGIEVPFTSPITGAVSRSTTRPASTPTRCSATRERTRPWSRNGSASSAACCSAITWSAATRCATGRRRWGSPVTTRGCCASPAR